MCFFFFFLCCSPCSLPVSLSHSTGWEMGQTPQMLPGGAFFEQHTAHLARRGKRAGTSSGHQPLAVSLTAIQFCKESPQTGNSAAKCCLLSPRFSKVLSMPDPSIQLEQNGRRRAEAFTAALAVRVTVIASSVQWTDASTSLVPPTPMVRRYHLSSSAVLTKQPPSAGGSLKGASSRVLFSAPCLPAR